MKNDKQVNYNEMTNCDMSERQILLNLNIGILGHVDSGKTTLARALSTVSSTAAYDKHPQSKERGITLDLGFSSLLVDVPDNLKPETSANKIQYTFVDCPGHASLIRTIIGGAQIIDMMLLVIDIQKGIQTQTAECLVIGEITCHNLIIVINKIDSIRESEIENTLRKLKVKIRKALKSTTFQENVPIYSVSALSGANMPELIKGLQENTFIPYRNPDEPLLFSVDHCFSIKGQGTICTGTILHGKVSVNDTIEISITKECKKVKSIQVFRKPVQSAQQGDRIGLCITQFSANLMERGIIAKPGLVTHLFAAIIPLQKIKYFKTSLRSNTKFHISIGHETVMGKITLFQSLNDEFSLLDEYEYIDELFVEEMNSNVFSLIEFELPVLALPNALVIGSKLDMDIHINSCRIAFWGKIVWATNSSNYISEHLPSFKIFKRKLKQGSVHRVVNSNELIVQNLVKKEAKKDLYIGKKVVLSTGEEGIIESTFGQTTKLRVRLINGTCENTLNLLKNKSIVQVVLKYKKYIFNKSKTILQ